MSIGETFKELCFVGLQGFGVCSDLLLKLSKLVFKRFLLLTNQTTEELLFKTSLGDSEINNSSFSSKLWREMRIGKTRSHVKSELIIIVHVLISKLNKLVPTFDNDLSFKNWVEHWINFILNRFNKDWETFLEWPFKSIFETWVVEGEDACLGEEQWLSSLNPLQSLTLWINHEWISR